MEQKVIIFTRTSNNYFPTTVSHCNSSCFVMQNLRYYRAKPMVSERQTIGFTMQ